MCCGRLPTTRRSTPAAPAHEPARSPPPGQSLLPLRCNGLCEWRARGVLLARLIHCHTHGHIAHTKTPSSPCPGKTERPLSRSGAGAQLTNQHGMHAVKVSSHKQTRANDCMQKCTNLNPALPFHNASLCPATPRPQPHPSHAPVHPALVKANAPKVALRDWEGAQRWHSWRCLAMWADLRPSSADVV